MESSLASSVEKETIVKEKSILELLDVIYLDTSPMVDEGVCKIISKRIQDKETSLLSVVEEMGPRLTSTHVLERSKAVEILAHVFTHLPSDYLNETELNYLVDFLCDRCKDQHIVIPKIIMCALPIVKCKNLPCGAGAKLLDSLFLEANVQSHIHKIRHTFFQILQVLLASDKRIEELQSTSSDFVMNFLQSMDGEKDPRNLLLLFRIIPKIVSKFKLDPFTEDFFEILSCYFPIDFNPTVSIPGEEPITRKDLGQALNTCLSQTNEFSEFLVPLIMEKLESTSISAKLDSLELLKLCCKRSYLPRDLEPYLGQIWHVMRQEIFMGGNDEVEKKCYEFLTAAFTMISKDSVILDTCLNMIYSECKHHLSEPELRLIMPTSNILRCITESGEIACTSVVQNLFSVVYDQVCAKSAISEKRRLLGIWEMLIRISRQYKKIEFHVLVSKWDEVRALWFTLLTNDNWEIVTVVLKILSSAVVLDADFPKDQRDMLQEHLLRLVCSNCSTNMPQDARSALVSLADSICYFYGEEFAETSIPRLLNALNSSISPASKSLCQNICDDNRHCQSQSLSVEVLGQCSHLHQSTFEKTVTVLLKVLESKPMDVRSIKCLENIVEKTCKDECKQVHSKPDLSHLISRMFLSDKVISLAFQLCKSLKLHSTQASSVSGVQEPATEVANPNENGLLWETLCQATTIIRNILRIQSEKEQSDTVKKYWNSKVKVKEDIERELSTIPGLLIESILGPIRPSVSISLKKDLINYIIENVVLAETFIDSKSLQELHVMPYVRLLASIVNKVEGDESLVDYLSKVDEYLVSFLHPRAPQTEDAATLNAMKMETESPNVSEEVTSLELCNSSPRINLINALVWIVKGLAMRGFKQLDLWVDKVIDLLRNETFGKEVVKSFQYLVADDPYSLNQESGCRFMILYRQRLFLMLVDKLVPGYRSSGSQGTQFNFIRALSSQLRHVPSEILFIKIDNVLPLLVASLKCDSSSEVLLSTLNSLAEMMQSPDTEKKLTEYCHDLVPHLTRLAEFKNDMNVRSMSLKCLRKCSKAPSHITLPLRDMVSESLIPCLDDPKRLVRKEAMLTRNIWVLIGAPGGL